MGQYWRLVDLTLMAGFYDLGKLGESICESFDDIADLLRTVVDVPATANLSAKKVSRKVSNALTQQEISTSKHKLGLLDLPAEVIYVIFEQMNVEDYEGAVMFAHADPFLFQCGVSRLRKLYPPYFAPCAGHRFICIGDYAEDLPTSLCNPEELSRMQRALGLDPVSRKEQPVSDDDDGENGTTSDDHKQTSDSLVVPEPQYARIGETADPGDAGLVRDIASAIYFEVSSRNVNWRKQSKFYWIGSETAKWLEPPSQNCNKVEILRNLSKRVFVRSDTLSEFMVGTTQNAALGRVLVAHICWSTDSSASMLYNGDITRGEWAGDAFDIVSPSTFNPDAQSPGNFAWQDVTASVASMMKDIWASEAGRW